MIGEGKYDAECTLVRQYTRATGAIVIVVGGKYGAGFSCQGDLATLIQLPDMLEDIARQIRADVSPPSKAP